MKGVEVYMWLWYACMVVFNRAINIRIVILGHEKNIKVNSYYNKCRHTDMIFNFVDWKVYMYMSKL